VVRLNCLFARAEGLTKSSGEDVFSLLSECEAMGTARGAGPIRRFHQSKVGLSDSTRVHCALHDCIACPGNRNEQMLWLHFHVAALGGFSARVCDNCAGSITETLRHANKYGL